MAHQYLLSIKGVKQGNIKGQAVHHSGDTSLSSAALKSFDLGVLSPRDASSGLPTGKRMHKPYTIFVEAGPLSQQLLQAFRTGEVLSEVNIQNQPEQIVPTVQLTNATISKYEQTRILPPGAQHTGKPLYSVDFVYQGIKSLPRP